MTDVSVVVATFGSEWWITMAHQRAIPSVPEGVPLIHHHGETLAQARNAGLDRVETGWVVHLDADDALEPGYLDALCGGVADIRVPAVRYVTPRRRHPRSRVPRVVNHEHECSGACLPDGNYIVVGAMARVDVLRAAGGWEEWAWCEDYALWARCWAAGATIETIPQAVYRYHQRPDGRLHGVSQKTRDDTFAAIVESVWPEGVPA